MLFTGRLLLATVGLLVSTSGAAFGQSMSDKAVEAEIEFARGLARDWAFVDMAQNVLDNVGKADLSERMNEELSLVRCEVFTNGARATFDPVKRNELLAKAISAYEDYIEENKYATNRPTAEGQLIDLAITYARSIDIALKDAAGDEAEALRQDKIAALTSAVDRTDHLIEEIDELPDDERTPEFATKRLVLLLQKGDIQARLSSSLEDDVTFTQQAKETLEELIFAAGEGTALALRAQMLMGDVYLGDGDSETAREFYKGTIDLVIPMDEESRNDPEGLDWKNLPFDIKQMRFTFVELGIPGVQRTSRTLGEPEVGIEYALFMNNLYRKEGFQLSVLGYDAMLEIAQTFLEAGGYIGGNPAQGDAAWYPTEEALKDANVSKRNRMTAVEFALDLARQVATDASGSQAGVDAGELLARINERPEVELPVDQLLQAAESKAKNEDYEAAIAGYYTALARMDQLAAADRAEFASRTYNKLGNTLRSQGRDLEAAMAFREALLNWADPEYNPDNAKKYNYTIRGFAKESGSATDPAISRLVTESEDFVIRYGEEGSGDEIIFAQGEKELKRGNYEEAIQKYRELKPEDGMYEPAVVRIGQSMLQMKQVREALEHFESYLNEYVKNPTHEPTTPIGEDRRHQSIGKAIYNAGLIEQIIAASKYKKSEGEDASGYEAVVKRLKDFRTDYSDVGSIVLKCQAMLADAYAKLGETAKAEAVVMGMIADEPDASETGRAALDLYQAYKDRRTRLESAAEPDVEAIAAATLDMAKALSISNGITPGVPYNYLRNESLLWLEIDRWQDARGPLEKIVKRFLDDDEVKDKVIKQVIPDLAEALIETGAVAEAKDLLSPYVIGEDAPLGTRTPTILMSRAMMGSIVGSGTNVQTTPGAGGTEEEFDFITSRLDTIENSLTAWTCEWYEAKLAAIYAYYVWGQDNAKKLETAKNLIDDITSFMNGSTEFELVDEGCNLEEVDAQMRRRLGSGTLSSRYKWLYRKTH
ncbi:hypothetical protein Poly30_37720 [Planctomycetes bacterium Poly30]|uniref:Uncharacterized protein n=1 Tax=Saltatorellus ferox TaxID=2528018 RepID=A0A518EVW8_9BACT|nr:hypothetical protein Poly30_37720 [Planctomycetes bacterium Poly30]